MNKVKERRDGSTADDSTGAKGFEATSIRGCGSSNAAAANSCKVGYSSVWKNENGSERAKSLEQGIALRIETNPTALKGRNQDVALSGLNGKLATTDRAMPYPIDCAASRLKTMGKVLGYGMMLLAFWIGGNSKAMGQTVVKQGSCGTNLTYVLLSDSTLTIYGDGAMTGYGSGSAPWYVYSTAIKTVIIGDSVTSIGNYGFQSCNRLTSVTIGNSVTTIGGSAFSGCTRLTSVTIPSGVTSIGSSAFYTCISLTSITIPNSVTTIGTNAFNSCSSFTSITIPNGVTSIGDYAFGSCTSLQTVNYNAVNCAALNSSSSNPFAGCTSFTTLNIGNSVISIPNNAFYGCNKLTSVTIGGSVASIGDYAFRNCISLTSVTIPDSVTSVGNYAFGSCTSLQTVNYNAINCTTMNNYNNYVFSGDTAFRTLNIGNQVKIIPNNAFYGCNKLTSVTIGNSVTTIGGSAFSSCTGLTSVSIPNSVKTIGSGAFYNCTGLTSATIGNSVTTIGNQAFRGCNKITSLTIGNSVTTIENLAFYGCIGLTSITIPNSVTTIGNSAFQECTGLTSVTIGNGVTSIGREAFRRCNKLTSITIPNSVTTIESLAFYTCISLTSVTIGNSVTTIGDSAFNDCGTLSSITSRAIISPVLGSNVFKATVGKHVYIPCGSYNSYNTAAGWGFYTSFIEMSDTTFISDTACYGSAYSDNGFNIPAVAGGVYYHTDSCFTVCLTLSTYPSATHTYADTICENAVYSDTYFSGLTVPKTYYDTLRNIHGCDSLLIEFTLYHYPSVPITPYIADICEGGIYSDDNFTDLTLADTYYITLQNVNGCDSIVELTLSIIPKVVRLPAVSICENASYHFAGKELTQAGTYYDTLQNINGCDSIIELTLIVNSTSFTPISDSIYIGNSYDFHGKLLTAAGVYYDTLQTIHNCDSIIELTLTVTGVGIVETHCNASLRVYPNPAGNQLTIDCRDVINHVSTVGIYDVVGQKAPFNSPEGGKLPSFGGVGGGSITIDISHLANGMYFLKIGNRTARFVKE